MTIEYGRLPKGGFAKLVSELLVEDLGASLDFWHEALCFEIAYRRPEEKFAYLENSEGAQIMLCERSGSWETGPMEKPYGRGVMFQIYIASIDPIIARCGTCKCRSMPVQGKFGDDTAIGKEVNAR